MEIWKIDDDHPFLNKHKNLLQNFNYSFNKNRKRICGIRDVKYMDVVKILMKKHNMKKVPLSFIEHELLGEKQLVTLIQNEEGKFDIIRKSDNFIILPATIYEELLNKTSSIERILPTDFGDIYVIRE